MTESEIRGLTDQVAAALREAAGAAAENRLLRHVLARAVAANGGELRFEPATTAEPPELEIGAGVVRIWRRSQHD